MIAMLVVALAIPLTGCGGSNAVGGYGGATPEAAFENFKSANKSKDFRSALGQTTPETQEMTIAGLAVFAPMMAAIDPEKGADKVKEIQKILDKHGVKTLDPAQMAPGQDPKAALKSMTANVKDKPACAAEIMTWMDANSSKDVNSNFAMKDMGDATLVDLKVEGDSATAAVKGMPDHPSDTLKFKKIDGAWYLDLSDKMPGGPG